MTYWRTRRSLASLHRFRSRLAKLLPIASFGRTSFKPARVGIVQADCTRLAGVSEYLAVILLAKKFPVRVVPHVGDMGQIHQHLVLFNHIALDHERLFLEYIPHLRKYFKHPAAVENGHYRTPEEPGCSTDLNLDLL